MSRPPTAADPYGIGPVRSLVGPALAIVGLVIVAILTINLINGQVPFLGQVTSANGSQEPGSVDGGDDPARTPAPSNVVIVEPDAVFDGSIVYAKAGNIWLQTADKVTQLTDGSADDSMPSFSPDGSQIYFIRTTQDDGRWPDRGIPAKVILEVPHLMRMPADGSGKPEELADGKFKQGRNTWSFWMRQPVLSPDGKTVAMVSDAPNPEKSNVVLQFLNTSNDKISRAGVPEVGILGHQDPEWRPDGRYLLYVRNGKSGSRGNPVIARYDPETKKARVLTAGGYLNPSYSPDGRYIAATRTSNLGSDVVILDAGSGRELTRVTRDGSSWGPTWSPAGDGIAFLRLNGQSTDLRLAKLEGDAPDWTVKEIVDLTDVSGLDAESRPDWFIPADQLPPPTAAPSVAPTGASASPSASPAT